MSRPVVAIVGRPNVGKSTLLSVVSNARPEIANYHFTTLNPHLGVVDLGDGAGFVMADIPGLIEGASEGVGLGHSFLRHIERTKVLVHVVDGASVEGRDPLEDILTINKELEAYNPELLKRPQVIAANKMDACFSEEDSNDIIARLKAEFEPKGIKVFPISAVSRQVREIEPPALYNLTELQKDANNYYGMTAGKSLEIAQKLYEKKLISYPRTAGRFLPRDVYDKLPRIMEKILNRKEFRPYVRSMGINIFDLPDKVVDEGQAAEHHAIIITDTYPEG